MNTKMFIPYNLSIALQRLESNGYSAYVVGGACRDSLIGRPISDYDVATDATPAEVIRSFSDFFVIETGIEFGTVTVFINGDEYQITTFRKDGEYLDGRHPQEVNFVNSLLEDLSRRDFTMNAIAYSEKSGFVDPFGGIEDIYMKRIKCVGNPSHRFSEDALRMLRAIRFASQLGFSIEKDTISAIKTNAYLIYDVSKERISAEMNKIIMSDNPIMFGFLISLGLMDYISSDISAMFDCSQNNPHHIYNVGFHSLHSVVASPNDLVIRLTMLLHDVGKPVCKNTENGIDHFYGHAEISSNMAEKILASLKYPNHIIDAVSLLILHHMDEVRGNKRILKKLLNEIGEDMLRKLFVVKISDASSQAEGDFQETKDDIDSAITALEKIIESKECFTLKDLAINGDDLIRCGIKEGKIIGDILRYLMDLVINCPDINDKNTLIKEAIRYVASIESRK